MQVFGALSGSLRILLVFGEVRTAARIFFRSVLEGTRDRVYILCDTGEAKGFCALRGVHKRHFFAKDDGKLIAPYFVKEKDCGKGYGKQLLQKVMAANPGTPLYALVHEKNLPSIKALEGVGFSRGERFLRDDCFVYFVNNESRE